MLRDMFSSLGGKYLSHGRRQRQLRRLLMVVVCSAGFRTTGTSFSSTVRRRFVHAPRLPPPPPFTLYEEPSVVPCTKTRVEQISQASNPLAALPCDSIHLYRRWDAAPIPRYASGCEGKRVCAAFLMTGAWGCLATWTKTSQRHWQNSLLCELKVDNLLLYSHLQKEPSESFSGTTNVAQTASGDFHHVSWHQT